MEFLLVVSIPLIIASSSFIFSGKGFKKITLNEFLILIGVSVFVSLISMAIIFHVNVTYKEIWNGLVISKTRQKVSCEHSYDCRCRSECSGSGKDRSCSTVCDTCYDHDYDFTYQVEDSAGETYRIDRIDSQGIKIPPRWNKIFMGEPTSSIHSYKNYIKASQGNLFKKEEGLDTTKFVIPEYPFIIYDYYKYRRLLLVGTSISNYDQMEYKLAEMNGRLGPKKQCNIIFVLVKNQIQEYSRALEQKWKGGNKNDIVIVISIDDVKMIQWASIFCLSESDIFRVKLRDEIQIIKNLDLEKIFSLSEELINKYYIRKRMRNFEYLIASVSPTGFQLLVSLVINTILCVLLTVFFWREDLC